MNTRVVLMPILSICFVMALSGCNSSPALRGNKQTSASATAHKPAAGTPLATEPTTPPVATTTKEDTTNGGLKIISSGGKDETNDEAGASDIPKPIAPARPDKTPTIDSPTSTAIVPTPVRHACRTRTDSLTPVMQSGDFYVVLLKCERRGDRLVFSGMVQYQGNESMPQWVSFGDATILSSYGKLYPVEDGHFGDSRSFGNGYSQQWISKDTSIAFSLDAGPITDDSPPTISLTLPALFGNARTEISFTGLLLQS